jgi:maltose alpha-D-glucosyltransferase / alpha-amylase
MSVADERSMTGMATKGWEVLLEGEPGARLEAALPELLARQRWFGGKARVITATQIIEAISMPSDEPQAIILFIDVTYQEGARDTYVLPVTAAFGAEADALARLLPHIVLLPVVLHRGGHAQQGILYDALWNGPVAQALLRAIDRGDRFPGKRGILTASPTVAYPSLVPPDSPLTASVMKAEQSNTSIVYGQHVMLKLYRRLQSGINPDLEMGRFLTTLRFPHSPPVRGALEYVAPGSEPMTVGLLQAFVPNEGNAWTRMLTELDAFVMRLDAVHGVDCDAGYGRTLWALIESPLVLAGRELLGEALEAAACLGRRTAALHLALGQHHQDADFAPEPMTRAYLTGRYESMMCLWKDASAVLAQRRDTLEREARQDAEQLLGREADIHASFAALLAVEEGGLRIRCHGDYHLGQVLWTGSDYIVIDFEGEPARPLHERRMKHSPLYDVAGMLRSFDYASWAVLFSQPSKLDGRLLPWMAFWSRWMQAEFLRNYLADVQHAPFWPQSQQARQVLLTVHQLEKAVYELVYELNNRPAWAVIPLKGIAEILQSVGRAA